MGASFKGKFFAAQIDAQSGTGLRPGTASQSHDEAMVLTRISCHAEILIITGYLPVGKSLLRGCSPQEGRRAHTQNESKQNAVTHE
jgi:hypothetical protein